MQCECHGEKTVIEVYPEVIGERGFFICDVGVGTREVDGEVKIVKEKCHVCKRVYLREMTFPKEEL